LLSLAITSLGVVIATRMQTFEGLGVISDFVVLLVYFLSGGVFPIEHLPRWMALLLRANPVTWFTAVKVLLSLRLFRRE
jgi:ABC-2 type transport system permease protein